MYFMYLYVLYSLYNTNLCNIQVYTYLYDTEIAWPKDSINAGSPSYGILCKLPTGPHSRHDLETIDLDPESG